MSTTNVQRIESGDPKEEGQVRQEVKRQERRKRWGWRGIAFSISLRSTTVKRTVGKARPYERVDYQPVRVMAMSPPPPSGMSTPDDGTMEEVTTTTTDKSFIVEVGPLDVTPPDIWKIPP